MGQRPATATGGSPRGIGGLLLEQKSFSGFCPITDAVEELASAGIEERGAVFTKREVVDFLLDLVGYVPRKKLQACRLLEPSFGQGDFLVPAIERLLTSWRRFGHPAKPLELAGAIRAVELHTTTFEQGRQAVIDTLRKEHIPKKASTELADSWLRHSDFLLHRIDDDFDFVMGNPPYVRLERVPDALLNEYRRRFRTVYDRADVYVPFIERSLTLLKPGGRLGFICADRWMKNRYGGPLREMIAKDFHVECYVDMVDTPAFHSDVIAYPAITVIARNRPASTRIAQRPEISQPSLAKLAKELTSKDACDAGVESNVREVNGFARGRSPWLLSGCSNLDIARRLEQRFPTIEEAGCKVGIGVATGADRVFIGPFDELNVEQDRKLPLATTRDLRSGEVIWQGLGVINPFAESGGLVDLARYPLLAQYFERRRELLVKRHVAKKSPGAWYRTIDRIHAHLTHEPKLLIPDIKGEASIALEPGRLYPHHNLYYITSSDWDIHALLGVLRSGIANLFVSLYSTRMRGDFLRFQAQYLRRIRLPHWTSICNELQDRLIRESRANNLDICRELTCEIYELPRDERKVLLTNSRPES